MTDDAATFLEAIHGDYTDDTPRVVFADWLDEHGRDHGIADAADRAAMIRAGVELATLPGRTSSSFVPNEGAFEHITRAVREDSDPRRERLERTIDDILARHPEWKRCVCPKCSHNAKTMVFVAGLRTDPRDCHVCGGTGDLLRRRESPRQPGFGTMPIVTRLRDEPDRGLLVVGATVAEIAMEERQRILEKDPISKRPRYRRDGYGGFERRIVPSPWLRALPLWYAVEVEGVEPTEFKARWVWWDNDEVRRIVRIEEINDMYRSPDAAKAALTAAIAQWRVRCLAKAKAPAYT